VNCPECLRPSRRCICRFVRSCDTPLKLTVIQHRDEAKHAKNTGALAARCLDITLIFDDQIESIDFNNGRHSLLYPVTDAPTQVLQPTQLDESIRVWIIDATWRKAKRLLAENPALQALPRIALSPTESQWRNRKPQSSGQLATIEAVSELHRQGGFSNTASVLDTAFEDFQKHLESFKS